MIYFIQAGDHGPVKIGYTGQDPRRRLKELQTGNHEPLRLIAVAPGDPNEEAKVHEVFQNLWIRGEWYEWHERIEVLVERVRAKNTWASP